MSCDEQDLQSTGVTLPSLSTCLGSKMTGQQKGSVSGEHSVSDSSSDASPSLGQWVPATPAFENHPDVVRQYPVVEKDEATLAQGL